MFGAKEAKSRREQKVDPATEPAKESCPAQLYASLASRVRKKYSNTHLAYSPSLSLSRVRRVRRRTQDAASRQSSTLSQLLPAARPVNRRTKGNRWNVSRLDVRRAMGWSRFNVARGARRRRKIVHLVLLGRYVAWGHRYPPCGSSMSSLRSAGRRLRSARAQRGGREASSL